MKGKFIGELEKILNSVRDNAKIVILSGSLVFSGMAYAGNLRIDNMSSSVSGSLMNSKHVEGATEGYDNYGIDSEWLNSPYQLQIYSNNPNSNPSLLAKDARGPNSTTAHNIELYNNGFQGTADNSLEFSFKKGDTTNFEWKNIFFNINGNKLDIKYSINTGKGVGIYNLLDLEGTQTGVYNTGDLEFFNHADLNRDKRVDGLDYNILANNWGRTGIVKGSNPADFNDYADIENLYDSNGVMSAYGDGVVDYNDLGCFIDEYLWNANDPNTW